MSPTVAPPPTGRCWSMALRGALRPTEPSQPASGAGGSRGSAPATGFAQDKESSAPGVEKARRLGELLVLGARLAPAWNPSASYIYKMPTIVLPCGCLSGLGQKAQTWLGGPRSLPASLRGAGSLVADCARSMPISEKLPVSELGGLVSLFPRPPIPSHLPSRRSHASTRN